MKYTKVFAPQHGILQAVSKILSQEEYETENFVIFNVDQQDLKKGTWEFGQEKEKVLIEKIETNAQRLKECCDILLGMQSGRDSLLIGKKLKDSNENLVEFLPSMYQKSGKTYTIEKELLRPLLRGKEVRKWNINFDGNWIIYSHKNLKDKVETMEESELKSKFPNGYKFLSEHIQSLENRKWYGKNPIELHGSWYALMYYEQCKDYNRPKILSPALTDKNNFSFDAEGIYYFVLGTAGVYGFLPGEINAYFLLGYLNSAISEFYLKHITPIKAGGYYQYSTKYLERLPIRLPQTLEEQVLADEITNRVEQILAKVKREQKIKHFPDEYIQEYRSKGEEFDPISLVFNSTYKALEPAVEENVDGGGYNVVIGKKESPIFVDSRLKADYIMAALRGKRAKKNEKLQLLVPKSDAIVEAILKELEDDKTQAKSPSVAELEAEINELVYKLYGLNEEDIKVIEEFLTRF